MSKKLIASILAVAFLGMVFVPAKATTIDELLRIIEGLRMEIARLQQGQQAGVCFATDLSLGMRSEDVKNLQIKLAVSPTSGYFGPITLAAVKAFQTTNGIRSTGYVGPITRAKLNELYCAPVTTTTTAPAAPVTTIAPGVEGFLSAKLAASPISIVVKEGESNKAVAAYEIKANLSDITLQRISLKFDKRPWLYVSNIAIYDGVNPIIGVEATAGAFEERIVASDYRLHLTGLNVSIPKGTTKTLTVSVSVPSKAHSTGTITITAPDNGFRGIDGAGLQQYVSVTDARTFSNLAAVAGELEVKLTAVAKDSIVTVSDSVVTEKVELAKIDFKAKNSDVKITKIIAAVNKALANNFTVVAPVVYLMDGATVLASANTVANATVSAITFENLNVNIVKDATKTLAVKADISELHADKTIVGESFWVALVVDNAKIIAEDALYATLGDAKILGADITSGKSYAYKIAPEWTLASAKITQIGDSVVGYAANTEIVFTVTAKGGDVYIAKALAGAAGTNQIWHEKTAAGNGGTLSGSLSVSGTPVAGANGYLVSDGTTRTFTITGHIPKGGAAGFTGARVSGISWALTDDGLATATNSLLFLENFKTIEVFVSGA